LLLHVHQVKEAEFPLLIVKKQIHVRVISRFVARG
jgi:hypothetical protein